MDNLKFRREVMERDYLLRSDRARKDHLDRYSVATDVGIPGWVQTPFGMNRDFHATARAATLASFAEHNQRPVFNATGSDYDNERIINNMHLRDDRAKCINGAQAEPRAPMDYMAALDELYDHINNHKKAVTYGDNAVVTTAPPQFTLPIGKHHPNRFINDRYGDGQRSDKTSAKHGLAESRVTQMTQAPPTDKAVVLPHNPHSHRPANPIDNRKSHQVTSQSTTTRALGTHRLSSEPLQTHKTSSGSHHPTHTATSQHPHPSRARGPDPIDPRMQSAPSHQANTHPHIKSFTDPYIDLDGIPSHQSIGGPPGPVATSSTSHDSNRMHNIDDPSRLSIALNRPPVVAQHSHNQSLQYLHPSSTYMPPGTDLVKLAPSSIRHGHTTSSHQSSHINDPTFERTGTNLSDPRHHIPHAHPSNPHRVLDAPAPLPTLANMGNAHSFASTRLPTSTELGRNISNIRLESTAPSSSNERHVHFSNNVNPHVTHTSHPASNLVVNTKDLNVNHHLHNHNTNHTLRHSQIKHNDPIQNYQPHLFDQQYRPSIIHHSQLQTSVLDAFLAPSVTTSQQDPKHIIHSSSDTAKYFDYVNNVPASPKFRNYSPASPTKPTSEARPSMIIDNDVSENIIA